MSRPASSASFDFSSAASRREWAGQLLGSLDENRFDLLARQLFRWQFDRVPAYRRLCLGHGVTPETLKSWRAIPAVPQQLFKLEKLFAHNASRLGVIYETSGTTTGQPGRQHLLRPDIYKAVACEGAKRAHLFQSIRHLHFLTPSPRQAPHSSLSAMFGFWGEALGNSTFWLEQNQIEFARLRAVLTAHIRSRQPIGIAGPAFSFVHLLDAWADLPLLRLPRGSWLLETGGFKGRSREVAKPELYAQLARTFSLPDAAIHNEYGMSELSSQSYASGTDGLHRVPPWARVLVVDPATNREVKIGQHGLVRWIDLANVDSVLALQTLDLAERTVEGFRLIGRLPRTEPRGCSLSVEDLGTPIALRP